MPKSEKPAESIHDYNIALRMLEFTDFEAASEHLVEVLNHFPIPIWAYNSEGKILFWNKESEQLFGYSALTVLNQPDPIGIFKQFQAENNIKYEKHFSSNKGKHFILQLNWYIKELSNNEINYWVCGYDISTHVAELSEIKSCNSKLCSLEKIFTHSDSFAYIRENDFNWSISYISTNISYLGYTQEDFINKNVNFSQIIHPEDIARVKSDILVNSHQNSNNTKIEYRILTKTNDVVWVSDMLEFIRDAKENVIQFQGIITNITQLKESEAKIKAQNVIIQERNNELFHTNEELLLSYEELRKANEKLAESEEKFKIISEQSLLGILILQDNIFKYANQAFCNASGYSKEEVMSWGPDEFYEYIHMDDKDVLKQGLNQIQNAAQPEEFHTTFRGIKKSGYMHWLSQWSKTIPYEGKPAILISLMDINDVKNWQDSLAESENNLRTKLDFILSPEIQMSDFKLTDIYDISQLQKIQDIFSKTHNHVACIISDTQGKPITKPTNFSPVCKIIRSTKKGLELCSISNKIIGEQAKNDLKPISSICMNCGFMNAGAPIIVGGKHIGTWMIGQQRTKSSNEIKMADLAKQIGVDIQKLLIAYNKMELQDDSQFHKTLEFLWLLTKEISALGYNNVKLAKDIEERKKIEIALRESEELYRHVVQTSPDGIAIVDTIGNLLFASPISKQLFGFSTDESTEGKNIMDFISKEDLERAQIEFMKVIKNKITNTNSYTMIKTDGTRFPAEVCSAPIKDYQGNAKGMISTLRDITERKKVEAELIKAKERAEESDRLKSTFLANMSHEIRTPMNGILGFANLLNEDNISAKERTEYVQIINQNGNLLLKLIDDILDIAKLEAGQLKIFEKPCNLNNELFEEYTLFKRFVETNKSKSIELKLNIPDINPDLKVFIDNTRIKQILYNLLSNALKFTEKGTIELGYLLDENSNIKFYVKDTGIGIPKEKSEIIFDRFRQVDETSSRKYGGTGLGLTISKNLVKLMKGDIWVESEVGTGSTFFFTIPLKNCINAQLISKKSAYTSNTVYNWTNKNILIAEDEKINFFYLKEILKSTNANIFHAKNGAEVIEYCRTNQSIDLVLMDIKMPDVSGYMATNEIKKIRRSLPVIAQTAYALEEEKNLCFAAGCDAYIAKPIDRLKLLQLISQFIK